MNIKYFIINMLFALLLVSGFVQAADLVFTPATPSVEMEGKITLSVAGTSGELAWSAQSGWIEGTGTTVTYIAPSQPGKDVVTVMDAEGAATVIIQINPKPKKLDFSPENAVWEVFTNRDSVFALALSKDKATLWVGTRGGVEKRNASTGELEKVYTNAEGLPDNHLTALLSDEHGGVWVGTWSSGLAHIKADNSLQVFKEENSTLPSNWIRVLLSDAQGGVWIASLGGFSHIKADGSGQITKNSNLPSHSVDAIISDEQGGFWLGNHEGIIHLKADSSLQVFNKDNSNIPSNYVSALLSDEQGGVWVGTHEGFAHLKANGSWQVFNLDNSDLPFIVYSLLSDAQGGVWVGTWGGLAHLKADGSWQITDNSNLPSNRSTALLSDEQGGIFVGTGDGVAHLKADGSWQVFKEENSTLPHNNVNALLSDEQGGVWVGTSGGGLGHLKADDSWLVFNRDNSNLPSNDVTALLSDELEGLWIGTGAGLAHLKKNETWQVFNINSNLPSNYVTALLSDEQGGVWVGTGISDEQRRVLGGTVDEIGGLAHLKVDGSLEIFNKGNSNLSSNYINALISDEQGGLWVGTGFVHKVFVERDLVPIKDDGGLAHLKADGTWEVFNEDNSNLPDNWVKALLSDEQGGIWVGTSGGLAHLRKNSSWQVFNKDNLNLLHNDVEALLSDNQGGIWVGIYPGLAHLKVDNSWELFNEDNSNLHSSYVTALVSDDQGGLWVGTDNGGGLAHLKPGEQQSGKRAAIIIAGGGNQATNTLWDTTYSISTYFYQMLIKRKFVKSEIYYLSSQPWADFNGDGFDDKIVDAPRPVRPISLDDIQKAFDWAKEQGKLDQPLYVFFIDHGGDGKLQLAKNTNMAAEELKAILDDYQQTTGNQVVAIIEACYSGSHLPILKAPNRAIISSARDNELAYFEDKQGFSRFFTKSLLKGMNFLEAFDYSVQKQNRMLTKMDERLSGGSAEHIATTQTPQFDDNSDGVYAKDSDGQWLKQLRINGNIQTGDFTLAVESLTTSSTIQVGQPFALRAKATTASGLVKRVWAVIRPPRMNLVLDSNGTPILAYPTEELSPNEEADVWAGTWNQAVYNGDYEISFYTKDNEGNIEMSEESVVISVTGGVEPPASASVDIVIEKERYARAEPFKFELVEQLGWGYDLYAAVVLPDGQFMTLEGPNKLAKLNQPEKWYKSRKYSEKVTAIDMTLPADLAIGKYCLYGILSPQREEPLTVMDKWVYSQRCFEVF